MEENGGNFLPYKDWSLKEDSRMAFDESTQRILKLKKLQLQEVEIRKSIKNQLKAVQLNLLYQSNTLLSNQSELLPLKSKVNIYSLNKINISKQLKGDNEFTFKTKEIAGDLSKIIAKKGTKVIFLTDTATAELRKEIANLKGEDNTIVCFSNRLFYEDLKATPNLVYFNKGYDNTYDYSILLQQLTGQLAFSGNLFCNDSLVAGTMTAKTRLARTVPEFCGLDGDTLKNIDRAVRAAIGGKAFPGCQVLVAKDGCIVYDKSFGYHTYDRSKQVSNVSMYDVASLTKVVSTTMVGMKLYEMKGYKLLDSLQRYLPDTLKDHLPYPSTIRNITFEELFTHMSGMPSGFPVLKYMQYTTNEIGRFDQYFCDQPDSSFVTKVAEDFFLEKCYQDSMWLKLNQIWLDPDKPYKYSDVNMNTLYFLFKSILNKKPNNYGFDQNAEELAEQNLFVEFLYNSFYNKLGMEHTKYNPLEHYNKTQIVPTENERYWRKQLLQGYVHDPNAALYGGIGGNAGIFSTTNDLAVLAEMLLNKGVYNEERLLEAATINKFTRAQANSYRGLGFNKPSLNTSAFGCADDAPVDTYGHTGFTGTCIWVDPVNQLTYVFLSNRVHPTVNNRIYQYGIRGNAHQMVYDALMFK